MFAVAVAQTATTPESLLSNLLNMAEDIGKASQLCGVVEDLGYGCTANEAAFKDVLKQVSAVDEAAVADLFSMIARTEGKGADTHGTEASVAAALGAIGLTSPSNSQSWNVEVAVKVLKSSYPNLRWLSIADKFDRPSFSLPSQSAFQTLIKAYKSASKEAFPLQAVVGRMWQNQQGQLEFLKHAIQSPPEVFTFEHAIRQQPPLEGLAGSQSSIGTPNQAWLCLDLIEVLCRLAESGHGATVQQILEQPRRECPELLLLGVASVSTEWNLLQREICDDLVPKYIDNHPNSAVVLRNLWPANKDVILRSMVVRYDKDANYISHVLDVCEQFKGVTDAMESLPFEAACDLAAAASQRKHLGLLLEGWLQDKLSTNGLPFAQAVVSYIRKKAAPDSDRKQTMTHVMLATLPIFMHALQVKHCSFHALFEAWFDCVTVPCFSWWFVCWWQCVLLLCILSLAPCNTTLYACSTCAFAVRCKRGVLAVEHQTYV